MFHELPSRDCEDGCATGQPQGIGPEAYLNGTSQGATPEDARRDGHIRGRSRRIHEISGLNLTLDTRQGDVLIIIERSDLQSISCPSEFY